MRLASLRFPDGGLFESKHLIGMRVPCLTVEAQAVLSPCVEQPGAPLRLSPPAATTAAAALPWWPHCRQELAFSY